MSSHETAGNQVVFLSPSAADSQLIRSLLSEVAGLKSEVARLTALTETQPSPAVSGWPAGKAPAVLICGQCRRPIAKGAEVNLRGGVYHSGCVLEVL